MMVVKDHKGKYHWYIWATTVIVILSTASALQALTFYSGNAIYFSMWPFFNRLSLAVYYGCAVFDMQCIRGINRIF